METNFRVYKNPNIDTSKVASRFKKDKYQAYKSNSDPTLNNVAQMQSDEQQVEQNQEVNSNTYITEKLLPDIITNSKGYEVASKGLATVQDVGLDLAKGIFKFFEGIGDFVGTGAATIGDALGADTTGLRELIQKDLSDKYMNSKWFSAQFDPIGTLAGKYDNQSYVQAQRDASYLNEAPEIIQEGVHGVAQSIGEMLPSIAIGKFSGSQVLQLGSFGLGAAGNASEQAINEGASNLQALGYGALSGATEVATEKIFDVFGFFGGGVADKIIAKGGKPFKIVAGLLGEGVEEVLSDLAAPEWKKIVGMAETYQENAPSFADLAESFALGSITSMIMGGASTANSIARYSSNGTKYLSLSEDLANTNEAVNNEIDRVIKDRVTKQQWRELQNDSQAYNNMVAEVMDELNALKQNKGDLPKVYRDIQTLIDSKNKIIEKMNNLLYNMSDEKTKKIRDIKVGTITEENGQKRDYTLGEEIYKNSIDISDINNHNVTFDKGVNVVGKANISNNQVSIDELSNQNFTNSQKVQANRIARAVNEINSKFKTNYDVVFTDGLVGGKDVRLNGANDRGTFYININSKKALLKTTMHELTHSLENTNVYEELAKYTKESMGEKAFEKAKSDRKATYTDLNQGDNDTLEQEVVADAVGDMFDTYEDVKKLVSANDSLARKIKNWIARKFNQSKGDTVLRKELKPAYEMINKALSEKTQKSEQNVSKLEKVRASAEVDSNGNELTAEQVNFFKDSKVRDANGNLMVMYHSTNDNFTVFEKAKQGSNTGLKDTDLGFFFADKYNKEMQSQFGSIDMRVYLNITKPLDLRLIDNYSKTYEEGTKEQQQVLEDIVKIFGEKPSLSNIIDLINELGDFDFDLLESLSYNKENIVKLGYDGIIDILDRKNGLNQYIAFESNQIKSIDNKNPSSNEDIRYDASLNDEDNKELKKDKGVSILAGTYHKFTPGTLKREGYARNRVQSELNKFVNDISTKFGFKPTTVEALIGGWSNDEFITNKSKMLHEVSYNFEFNKDEISVENATLIADLAADLLYEVQDATLVVEHLPNEYNNPDYTWEMRIPFKKYNARLKNILRDSGIYGYSINQDTNYIVINDYKGTITREILDNLQNNLGGNYDSTREKEWHKTKTTLRDKNVRRRAYETRIRSWEGQEQQDKRSVIQRAKARLEEQEKLDFLDKYIQNRKLAEKEIFSKLDAYTDGRKSIYDLDKDTSYDTHDKIWKTTIVENEKSQDMYDAARVVWGMAHERVFDIIDNTFMKVKEKYGDGVSYDSEHAQSQQKSVKSIVTRIYRNIEDGKGANPFELKDLVRTTFIFNKDNYQNIKSIANLLYKNFANPDSPFHLKSPGLGYVPIHINLKYRGIPVEIQFHTEKSWEAKLKGDGIYDKLRMIRNDARLTEEEKQEKVRLTLESEKTYKDAYDSDPVWQEMRKLAEEYNEEYKNNKNIKYSVEEDSEGNRLSVEQAEFFKDSKARDSEGNLLNLFHGTRNGGFMEFLDRPIFLSDNYETASGYGLSDNPVITQTFDNIDDLLNYLYGEGDEFLHLSEKGIDFTPIEENKDALEYRDSKIAAFKERGINDNHILIKNLKNAKYVLSLPDAFGGYFDYRFYTEQQALKEVIPNIQSHLSENMDDVLESENINSVYQVYANIKNPLRINCYGNTFLNIKYQGKEMSTDEIAEKVKSEGKYDGIIFKNIMDNGERDFFNEAGLSNVYVVFNSNQVKATDNFNPSENNDIRYSTDIIPTNALEENAIEVDKVSKQKGIEDTKNIDSNYVKGRANYDNDAVYNKNVASKLLDKSLINVFKEQNGKTISIKGQKDKIINYIFQELNKTKLEDIISGQANDSMANKLADYIIKNISTNEGVLPVDKAALVNELSANIQEAYLQDGKIAGYKAMKEKLSNKIVELKTRLRWNKRLVVETRKLSRAINTFKTTTNRKYSNNPSAKPLDKMFTPAVDILKKLKLTNFYTQEARSIMQEYRTVFYNENNEMLKDDYSQMVVDMIDSITNGSGNLDIYEMNTLVNIYQSLNKLMKYYDNVVFEDRVEKASEVAKQLETDIASGRSINKNIKSTAFNSIQKPRLVLRQFDGSFGDKDNSLTNLVYGELRKAEDTFKKNDTTFREKILDFESKHKKFTERMFKENVDIKGKKIPLGEAITIYQWSRREQARGHFMSDVNPVAQGINIYSQKNGNFLGTFTLTQEDIDKLYNSFDKETLEYIKFIDGLIEEAKVLKEETDYKALGFTNAIEDFYFPIMTDSMYNSYKNFGDVRNVKAIDSVLGLSMNKNVVTNANNKLRLQNAYDIVNRHLNQASKYNAYYVTIKAIQKALNTYTENKTTAKQSLIGLNPDIIDYIDNLIIDVADVRQHESKMGEQLSSFLRGNLATANLGLNLKVMFNQLSSIPTALSILSPTSLTKSYKMAIGKNAANEMDKYCRYTYYRNFYNTKVMSEIYRSDSNTIVDSSYSKVRQAYHKVQNLVMRPISFMDRRAMVRLWNACQVEVEAKQGLKLGTEENKVKAAELLEKVVRETQPDYSPLEAPTIKKSRSELVRWMTMFTTQPLQNLNQIIEASNDIKNIKSQIKANGTNEELTRQLKQANRKLMRNVSSVMAANLMYTLIALGFKELLGKRKDDEGIAKEFIVDFMGSNVGMIPVIREIYNKLFNNYDISADPLGAVNDFIDATKSIYNNVSSGNYQGLWYKLSKALSTLTGIPFKNINEYSMTLIGAFSPSTAYKYRSIWYNKTISSFTDDLEKAIAKKDDSQINTIIQALYSKKGIALDNNNIKELNKLSKASTKNIITLKNVTSTATINGETVEINDTSKIKKYYSDNVNASLSSLIKNAYYAGLSKEEKAYAIKLSNDASYYKALTKALNTDIKENKINLLTKAFSGNSYYTLIAALSKCKNSLKGNKQAIQKYINSLRLSKEQKYILYGLAGYKPLNDNASTQVSNYLTIKGYTKEMREYIMDFAKLL